MRKLKTSDLFSLTRIIKKMDLKKEITELQHDITGMSEEDKSKAEKNLSLNLMLVFVENIGSAEKEIYKLLADITNKNEKEIADMELSEFMKIVEELFTQEQFGSFLSTALK